MRKGRPATLTSSLLARKGEAEPARLGDGTVPKDVIALQEELVARVAADISRQSQSQPAVEIEARAVIVPAEPSLLATPPAVAAPEPAAAPSMTHAMPPAATDEDDDLGSAPVELPEGSADEPDYDPAVDAAAVKDSQITLADWTARAESGDTPFAYERMSDAEPPERSVLIPLALGIAVVAVVATLAIWQVSDHGVALPPGSEQTSALGTPESAPATAAPAPPAPSAPPAAAKAPPAHAAVAPPAQFKPAQSKPEPSRPEPVAAMAGGYVLQLVSTVSQASAERAWSQIETKLKAIGVDKPHIIEQAQLGAKGTRYRVELTGFATAAAAQQMCKTLQAYRQSCLVLHP